MYALLTSLAFLVVFLSTEILIKKYHLNSDITRKIAHIVSGVIAFFTPYYLTQHEIIFIGALFVVLLILTKVFKLMPSIHAVERQTWGEIFFPLGICLSALLFLPDNIFSFQFGMLVLAFSDAGAALIGMPYGKHVVRIFGNKKSIEGSCTFLLITYALSLLFVGSVGYDLLLIGVLLTLTEFVLIFGLDNLVLPVLAGYLLTVFK